MLDKSDNYYYSFIRTNEVPHPIWSRSHEELRVCVMQVNGPFQPSIVTWLFLSKGGKSRSKADYLTCFMCLGLTKRGGLWGLW